MYTDQAIRRTRRTRILKAADAKVLKSNGPNTALGYPTKWSIACRNGARWADGENNELTHAVAQLHAEFCMHEKKRLNADHVALIAWRHGRTANAVNDQLYKLLGTKMYFRLFELS